MAPRMDRRLAAVMAVDVVGYSRLVGLDEAGTLARVRAHRVEFAEPLIAEYHGRVVKLTGDGALVEFASAVDAVECALAIQNGMAEREVAEAEERRIRFRIGINIGDIVLEDGDIFGDGVNVAARLEGLADPGGICIARNVYNQVKGKLDLGFQPMGAHQVKNIADPVEVYRVLPEPGAIAKTVGSRGPGTTRWRWAALVAAAVAVLVAAAAVEWWSWNELASEENVAGGAPSDDIKAATALPLPDKPSIAVLPFDNLSGDERYERLADGITEDIITDLSRFRDLFVIARNSTQVYKGKPVDVRQIARELGVQFVLEGSVQTDGDQVRVTAQLIDATTGDHVWSERYDRRLDEIFSIQDEVTRTTAASLAGQHGALARAGRQTARRKPPENLQAYDYYNLGMEAKHRFTKEDNKKAQNLFKKALDLDPNFARAYVGLAHTYNLEVDMGFGNSYQESMDNWRKAARKAIALDPDDGEARFLLGWYYAFLNEYDRAVAELDSALELNPSNADVLAVAALMLDKAGQPERALGLVDQAIRLNPHHPDWYYGALRDVYFHNRRFEEAIAATNRRLYPNPVYDPQVRAMSYALLGRQQDAAGEVKLLLGANPDYSAEKFLSDTGTYARDIELNLFLDGHRKAGLPLCASEAQLAKYPDMKRLEQCESQRASG